VALGSTQPLTEMSTRCTLGGGGKFGRCVGLTILPPLCADCLEILQPQPPGTLKVCPGLYKDCFNFTASKEIIVTSEFIASSILTTTLSLPFSQKSDAGPSTNLDQPPQPHNAPLSQKLVLIISIQISLSGFTYPTYNILQMICEKNLY
jgi:hypothetical protein